MRALELTMPTRPLRPSTLLAVAAVVGALVAAALSPHGARGAAGQTWSPFVLVLGLLLVGMAAEEEGAFRAAGRLLSRIGGHGATLFLGASALIVLVTATLNLDTSVVFLTPLLVAAARHRGGGEAPLLYGCLLLSNAGSLFLPGSNLTNLIVLGHLDLSGSAFLSLMWPAASAATVVTVACLGVWGHRDLRNAPAPGTESESIRVGPGVAAVLAVTVLVVVLRSPAVPVLGVGIAVAALRLARRKTALGATLVALDLPVLLGLFGLAVVMGTVGRAWDGPSSLLQHAGSTGTAVIAGGATVVMNNLPAAALLAAGHSSHPAQLLVGLDLGPNLFVTGSLAWFLWLRVARASGASPSVARAARLGVVVVPLSMAAALGALVLA